MQPKKKGFCEDYLNILVLLPNMSWNRMHARAYSIEICCYIYIYIMMIEGSLIDIKDYTVQVL